MLTDSDTGRSLVGGKDRNDALDELRLPEVPDPLVEQLTTRRSKRPLARSSCLTWATERYAFLDAWAWSCPLFFCYALRHRSSFRDVPTVQLMPVSSRNARRLC